MAALSLLLLVVVVLGAAMAAPAPEVLPCDSRGQTYTVCPSTWRDVGPGGYLEDASEESKTLASASATQQAINLPGTSLWFLGTVNGGVWRSKDISADRPEWEPVTDNQPVRCSSIAALAATEDVVLAGCGGSTSSEMGTDWNVVNSGPWGGIMVSYDKGDHWEMTNFPINYYVTSLVALSKTYFIASVRSHFYNPNDGGIWVSKDSGKTWTRTSTQPVFDLLHVPTNPNAGLLAAGVAYNATHTLIVSTDGGQTWTPVSAPGLDWKGFQPFYVCLSYARPHGARNTTLFVGALTVNTSDTRHTGSGIFYVTINDNDDSAVATSDAKFTRIPNQPELDQDAMPKDRMAILVDPDDNSILYVAGNAGATAWRADWSQGVWASLLGNDTVDGREPHVDCRNYAWDPASHSLVLVSDGGAFMRKTPKHAGGRWVSINGDMGAMEFLTAHWDVKNNRWVAGAQDNCVQISAVGAGPKAQAYGVIEGDGTVTAVDNTAEETRLFGTIQFLGQRDLDATPPPQSRTNASLRDSDTPGLRLVTGVPPHLTKVEVPVSKYFPDEQAFPFFVHPYALNSINPSALFIWANGTGSSVDPVGQSGWWAFDIPAGVKSPDDIPKPAFVGSSNGTVITFVCGGIVDGKPDPSVLVGMNNTHLYHRSRGGPIQALPLPVRFASPVILTYDAQGKIILGPVSHGKTVSLAVSPSNADLVAVTGWPDVRSNGGNESVWLTHDGGHTWMDITGNLLAATRTPAMARPSGLLIFDVGDGLSAVLVGTVSGIYVSWTDRPGHWARLGTCKEFPLVLTMGISHEPTSDTILAATMGRGVYQLVHARDSLLLSRLEQIHSTCIDGK